MVRNLALFVALTCLATACTPEAGDSAAGASETPSPPPTVLAVDGQPDLVCEWARVLAVTDGDTIDVSIGGDRDTVRYMGVDTPEVNHPTRGLQPFGPEASEYNAGLVEDEMVCLEREITNRDDFGRLLRYVWLPDGRMVNEELLRAGLAQAATYPPDVKYVESRYLPAQREALEAGRGIWAGSAAGADACEPAYPGLCIPPPPPDLDCGDVPHRRFVVLPPDPHHFDMDGNGYGCEG